jgi:hypothetical protein
MKTKEELEEYFENFKKEAIKVCKTYFTTIDIDKNGTIDQKEFLQSEKFFLELFDEDYNEEEVLQRFKMLDENNDKTLTEEEFLKGTILNLLETYFNDKSNVTLENIERLERNFIYKLNDYIENYNENKE